METEKLLIKVKALDLLIEEVFKDIQNDEHLIEIDIYWEADNAADSLQRELEIITKDLKERI